MLEHALKYLKYGYSPIPMGDKQPMVKWKHYQENRPSKEQVVRWWSQWPNANIAVITGKRYGITVVDIDKKSGGLETMKEKNFPPTTTVRTGGGGWHLYYKYTDKIRTGSNRLPGIDIRNDGAYVIAPPSVHRSGNKYAQTTDEEIADFPTHLFPEQKQITGGWFKLLEGVPEGTRDQSAVSLLGGLMRAIPPDKWATIVWPFLVWWNERNIPPLTVDELGVKYKSIAKLAISNWEYDKEKLKQNMQKVQ